MHCGLSRAERHTTIYTHCGLSRAERHTTIYTHCGLSRAERHTTIYTHCGLSIAERHTTLMAVEPLCTTVEPLYYLDRSSILVIDVLISD